MSARRCHVWSPRRGPPGKRLRSRLPARRHHQKPSRWTADFSDDELENQLKIEADQYIPYPRRGCHRLRGARHVRAQRRARRCSSCRLPQGKRRGARSRAGARGSDSQGRRRRSLCAGATFSLVGIIRGNADELTVAVVDIEATRDHAERPAPRTHHLYANSSVGVS